MKERNEDRFAAGEAPRIRADLAEHLDEKPEGPWDENEGECFGEPDDDGDFEDCIDDWDDSMDEDEEFDDEDWDDAWDEDDYGDRRNRDSGMRRHRTTRRDSDDPLWPTGVKPRTERRSEPPRYT